ncbi:MAG: helix-turn-helix domain-containing protein [Clostridia bacterium]|nr:helix-turn-helix domain-containing protein [Clostridia bacterium]
MRKGEEKKQEILAAAERLFCVKGYRETSVQDILDALKTSKGSFYHHFESKDMVLETICAQRAERSAAETAARLEKKLGTVEGINTVLSGMIPLRKTEVSFMAVLLPQLQTREGRTLCVTYEDALVGCFLPLMEKALDAATKEKQICLPVAGGVAEIMLRMVNHAWITAAKSLLQDFADGVQPRIGALLDASEGARACIERLLCAPFDSVRLISLKDWEDAARLLAARISVAK